jgi:hypothetical protein
MRSLIAFVVLSILASSVSLADGPRVWVQPFTEANPQQSPDWISKTLHQSLSDELAGIKGIQLTQSATKPADAQYMITGQIQRLDGELRVSGQVIDAKDGKIVGGFKATGSDRELFAIEDSIAQQVKPLIAPESTAAVAGAPATTQPNVEMPFAPAKYGTYGGSDLEQSLQTNAPLQPNDTGTYQQPVNTQPTYPTNYGMYNNSLYGYPYGYGYPWGFGYGFGGNVIIVNRDGRHHGDHHDFDHRGGISVGGLPSTNGQRIRAESSFQGNPPSILTHTITPGAPGTSNVIGPTQSHVAAPTHSNVATPTHSNVGAPPSNVATPPSNVTGPRGR